MEGGAGSLWSRVPAAVNLLRLTVEANLLRLTPEPHPLTLTDMVNEAN